MTINFLLLILRFMQAPGFPGKKGDQVKDEIKFISAQLTVLPHTVPHSVGFPLCGTVVAQGEQGLPGLEGSRGQKGEPGLRGEKVSSYWMMTR